MIYSNNQLLYFAKSTPYRFMINGASAKTLTPKIFSEVYSLEVFLTSSSVLKCSWKEVHRKIDLSNINFVFSNNNIPSKDKSNFEN